MLPKALSNGLCSLRPGEDRLAMLAEMPITSDGEFLKPRFAAVIMRSAARLTYDDTAALFRGEENAVPSQIAPMLLTARKLYEILAKKRRARGTLDFTIPEASYKFSNSGDFIAMEEASRNDAHMLIEEFMIAANEAVANYLGKRAAPFLYRVHPAPDADKLNNLFNTLRLTAADMLPAEFRKTGADASALLTILANAQGTPKQFLVNRLCLRSMGLARYQAENTGHYGLASAAYCHFTSPIRRYADVLVHRALKASLAENMSELPNRDRLDEIANGLNEQERKAVECERDMARRMACLALMGHVGETMDGVISGVTDFGVFVEFKDMPADGLIRMADLGQEWFELDQARQCLVGRSTGKLWRLGEELKVKIAAVDLSRLEITLIPEGHIPGARSRKDNFRRLRKPGKAGSKSHAGRQSNNMRKKNSRGRS